MRTATTCSMALGLAFRLISRLSSKQPSSWRSGGSGPDFPGGTVAKTFQGSNGVGFTCEPSDFSRPQCHARILFLFRILLHPFTSEEMSPVCYAPLLSTINSTQIHVYCRYTVQSSLSCKQLNLHVAKYFCESSVLDRSRNGILSQLSCSA